jgi:type IV fimbrial biogenesis protein FimT
MGFMRTKKGRTGFTLMEVIIAVAIIGILSAIAVPQFFVWVADYRLRGAARDLYSNFQKAKMTAIKRNINCAITFNKIIEGTKFDYVVYIDANKNNKYDPNEDIISQVLLSSYKSVFFNTNKGGGDGLTFENNSEGNPTIAFKPNSIPRNQLGGFTNGTAYLKNTNEKALEIRINQSGNISIK